MTELDTPPRAMDISDSELGHFRRGVMLHDIGEMALDIPFCHHEAWDALQSERPFRPAWPKEKIVQYIQEKAGSQFDPQVVEAFIDLLKTSEQEEEE
jgi:hypothetical protein